jgi:hypothetical protein
LQKLQKHARSKCAVFAPLLRAGFRNFFANHFPFGIETDKIIIDTFAISLALILGQISGKLN